MKSERMKNNNNIDVKTNAPDGGWGWLVCLACLFGNFTTGGICLSFGILLPSLKEYYGESTAVISLVGSLLVGIILATSPFAAILANKIGLRPVYMMGSVISGVSLLASTFSSNAYVLLLTYGILSGIGLGLIILPVSIACNFYFEKRRALATGIAKTGFSLGGFVYPPVTEYLLDLFQWKAVVYMYAGIAFISCFFGALVRPLDLISGEDENEPKETSESKNNPNSNTTIRRHSSCLKIDLGEFYQHKHPYTDTNDSKITAKRRSSFSVFQGSNSNLNNNSEYQTKSYQIDNRELKEENKEGKILSPAYIETEAKVKTLAISKMIDTWFWFNPSLMMFLLSRFLGHFSMVLFFMFLPTLLLEFGYSLEEASLMLTVLGISNTLFRIVVGALMDHPMINPALLTTIGFILQALVQCLLPFLDNYLVLMILGGVIGIIQAPYNVGLSIICGEIVPMKNIASTVAKMALFQGIGSIMGPSLAGLIYDITMDIKVLFLIAASVNIIAGIACGSSVLISRRTKIKQLNI